MSEILGNVYDRSIAIVFRAVFFGTFRRLWKIEKSNIYVFLLLTEKYP